MPQFNSSLVQRSRTRGEARAFEVYDGKFLRVSLQTLFRAKRYHINLGMLEPWPRRRHHLAWGWLLAALAPAAAGGALFRAMSHGTGAPWMAPTLVGLLVMTCGAFAMFLYRSRSLIEFHSRHGHCVLFGVMPGKPRRKACKAFVEELTRRSLTAGQTLRLSTEQMLAIELKELRRLTDEGAVSRADYEAAKRRIFKFHDLPARTPDAARA